MPTTYPTELKVKTIRRYEKGESIKALSQELHISQSTLYNWRKEYCSIKTPNRTYTPAEFNAISRRLQKLEHHMEIIRLTGYLSSIPLQKKLATLEKLYNRPDNPFSVHELFYPQLGVKTLLDGGRRRTKNLYGVVKRTVPAGQVRQ